MPRKGKKGAAVTKSRFIPKMFLRGDSVIYVLKNPKWYNHKLIFKLVKKIELSLLFSLHDLTKYSKRCSLKLSLKNSVDYD